jgi:hypothetical protein
MTETASQPQHRYVMFPQNSMKRSLPSGCGLEWLSSEPAAMMPTVKVRRLVCSQREADRVANKPRKGPESKSIKAVSSKPPTKAQAAVVTTETPIRRRRTAQMTVDLALAVTKDDATACLGMLLDECRVPVDPALLIPQDSPTWQTYQDMHAFWRALHGILGQSPHTVMKK